MPARALRLIAFATLSAASLMTGCVMNGPFVEADIDQLVSKDSAQACVASGADATFTPLAVPVSLAAVPADSQQLHNAPEALQSQGAQAARIDAASEASARMSLPRCIDAALSNSPVTRAAWESARATAAAVGMADAAYGPDIFLTGEVWTGYFEFFAAQKRYEAGVALLAALQDSYDSIDMSYLNGLVTINDLLPAESDLFDARFELIRSRAQLLTASATFVLALGSSTPARRNP